MMMRMAHGTDLQEDIHANVIQATEQYYSA